MLGILHPNTTQAFLVLTILTAFLSGVGPLELLLIGTMLYLQIQIGYAVLGISGFMGSCGFLDCGIAIVTGSTIIGTLAWLRGTFDFLHPVAPFILTLTAAIFALFYNAKQLRQKKVQNTESILVGSVAICSAALLCLTYAWGWLAPWLLISLTLLVLVLVAKEEQFRKWATALALSTAVLLAPLANPLRANQWWGIRRGVLPDPDTQFVESAVNSVGLFGSSDNIFGTGYPFRYHILGFAWINGLAGGLKITPFVVSAIVAPIVLCLTLFFLLYGLLKRSGQTLMFASLTTVAVAALWGDRVALLKIWHPFSLSHNYALGILVAVIVLMQAQVSKRQTPLLIGLSVASVLAKASLVVPISALLMGRIAMRQGDSRSTQRWGYASALVVVVLVFIVHYQAIGRLGPTSGEVESLFKQKLGFGEILGQNGFGPPKVGGFLALGVCGSFVMSALVTTGALGRGQNLPQQDLLWRRLFIVSGIFTLVFGLMVNDALESADYSISFGILLLTIGGFMGVSTERVELRSLPVARTLFGVLIFATLVAYFWALGRSDSIRFVVSLGSLAVVALLTITMAPPGRRRNMRSAQVAASALALNLCITFGSVEEAMRASHSPDRWGDYQLIGGGPELRSLLLWVRDNTPATSTIATVRQCNYAYEEVVGFDLKVDDEEYRVRTRSSFVSSSPEGRAKGCQPWWTLTSALTARPQFVESYTVTLPYSETSRRLMIVNAWLRNPDEANRQELMAENIEYVIVERQVPYAENIVGVSGIVFKNQAGFVVALGNK